MKFYNSLAFGVAAFLMAATPVFAQSTPDSTKPNAPTDVKPQPGGNNASSGGVASTKQRTQGVPAGGAFNPPQYGGAQKQHSQGVPAGGDFSPPQYGMAQKQHTHGVPAGGAFNAPQYGTDQAGIRK